MITDFYVLLIDFFCYQFYNMLTFDLHNDHGYALHLLFLCYSYCKMKKLETTVAKLVCIAQQKVRIFFLQVDELFEVITCQYHKTVNDCLSLHDPRMLTFGL